MRDDPAGTGRGTWGPSPPSQAGALPSALPASVGLGSGSLGVTVQAGSGVQWQSWKGHHFKHLASWTLTSFLVAFVFPDSGVDVIASWTELWWLGNPVPGSYQGLPI